MVSPAEIRSRVLEQHATLREKIETIETLARDAASGAAGASELDAEFEALLLGLQAHMRFEDRVLPEVLREADAWGEERVARFHAEHAQQRIMIQTLLDTAGERTGLERALRALGFCALLQRDMVAEESVFLHEHVLRDDPIAIAPEPE